MLLLDIGQVSSVRVGTVFDACRKVGNKDPKAIINKSTSHTDECNSTIVSDGNIQQVSSTATHSNGVDILDLELIREGNTVSIAAQFLKDNDRADTTIIDLRSEAGCYEDTNIIPLTDDSPLPTTGEGLLELEKNFLNYSGASSRGFAKISE